MNMCAKYSHARLICIYKQENFFIGFIDIFKSIRQEFYLF